MENTENRMARNALTFLPAKILEGLVAMATTALYTDLFSTAAYGAFQMLHTNVLFIYLVSAGWLLNASVRYVGDCREGEKRRAFCSTVGVCLLAVAGAAALVSLIAFFAAGRALWPVAALMFSFYALFQIANGLLVQEGRVGASVVLSLGAAVWRLIGAYAFVALLRGGASTPYPAALAAVSADLVAGVSALIVLRMPKFFSFRTFSKKYFVKFLRFGVPLVGFSVSVGLLNLADKYLVNFILGGERFAVYSANNSVSTGLFTLVNVGIMRGVYPAVLAGWRKGGEKEAKPLLDRGARLYLLLALPAAAGLAAVGPSLSGAFFTKPEYHEGVIISIAAFSMFFMGLTEYVIKAWELRADTLPILQNSIIAALVKIIATVLLLRMFDIRGAALGGLVAFIAYFLLSFWRVRKRFVFSIPVLSFLRIGGSAAACAFAARWALSLSLPRAAGLAASVALGGITYAALLILTGEAKEEAAALLSFIRKE